MMAADASDERLTDSMIWSGSIPCNFAVFVTACPRHCALKRWCTPIVRGKMSSGRDRRHRVMFPFRALQVSGHIQLIRINPKG